MKKRRTISIVFFFCVLCLCIAAQGCAYRPESFSAPPKQTPAAIRSVTATPTPLTEYAVSFYRDGTLWEERQIAEGDTVRAPELDSEDVVLIGWTDENGEFTDIENETVTAQRCFDAVLRPRLSQDAPYLFPDENGFLRPADALTNAQAEAMAEALLNGSEWALPALSGEKDAPVTSEEFTSLLSSLFDPRRVEETVSLLGGDKESLRQTENVSRAEAAQCLKLLLDREAPETVPYYPDVSPKREYGVALLATAAEGTLDKDTLVAAALDGFLWFDGYLYRLDDEGYFLTDTTEDDLYYDGNGRYTCGNTELDDYVAETVAKYLDPSKARRENLHTLYYHIKNDFMYLTRNYYDSGAVGWDIDEALTLFSTGKGNCYCYAGAFCALARGMGYNAVTYSGTMGNQNQKHAWTEITLDDVIYICDPEIEMNYWYLQMYTDNYMMPRQNAGGWNYQAVGRN